MGKLIRGLIFLLCGVTTTVLTALGLVYLETHYDAAIYGYVYGFIIPIGAILSGLIAASGYFIGSRLASYRPGRNMLIAMLGVSGGNFFLIYWLEYRQLTVDGQLVSSWMKFTDYLKFELTHTALSTGAGSLPGDTMELGIGGYLYAFLLIVGFALGGLLVFLLVRWFAYCNACGLYMVKLGSQKRYFVRQEDLMACSTAFQAEMKQGSLRKAMELHGQSGVRTMDETTGYSLRADIRQCKRCGSQWVGLVAQQRTNKSWNALSGAAYSAYCKDRVDVVEQMASSN